jgi:hypothetical protein
VRESIDMFRDVGAELGFAMAFEATAAAAAWVGDADLAARLYGKADELRRQLGGGAPTQVFVSPAFRDKAVRALGAERFEALAAEGAGLTNEATIGLVDTFEPPPDAPPIRRQ